MKILLLISEALFFFPDDPDFTSIQRWKAVVVFGAGGDVESHVMILRSGARIWQTRRVRFFDSTFGRSFLFLTNRMLKLLESSKLEHLQAFCVWASGPLVVRSSQCARLPVVRPLGPGGWVLWCFMAGCCIQALEAYGWSDLTQQCFKSIQLSGRNYCAVGGGTEWNMTRSWNMAIDYTISSSH